jgi:hypothetical protein
MNAAGILIELNCIPFPSAEPLCAVGLEYDLNIFFSLTAMFPSTKMQSVELD